MKTRMSFRLLAVLMMAAFVFASCDDDDDDNKVETPQSIVDVAVSNPDFSVLVAAVQKAGLVDALADPNADLTAFAPTNAAFEALFATLEVNGVEDLDVETLTAVLLSHVVEGNVVAVDVSSGSVPTLNAEKQLFNMVVCTKRFKFVPLF